MTTLPVGNPDPAWGDPTFADDFLGTAIDLTHWRIRNNAANSNEAGYILAANATEGAGLLTLQGLLQSAGGRSYTDAYLDTISKFSADYGYWEMRAQMPTQANTSKGMWPAFWLRPDDGGLGEIDIVECIGSAAGSTEYTKTHQTIWYDYSGTYPKQSVAPTLPAGGTTDGWHTYGLEKRPGSMKWYVDNVLVFTRDTTTTTWFAAAFDGGRLFNIRLNLQIGGSWAGTPDGSTAWPANYNIDWVRYWAIPAGGSTTGGGGTGGGTDPGTSGAGGVVVFPAITGSIGTPSGVDSVNPAVSVHCTAGDFALEHVQITVLDSGGLGFTDTQYPAASPFDYTTTTVLDVPGGYTVTAVVYDVNGNSATLSPGTVVVTSTAPANSNAPAGSDTTGRGGALSRQQPAITDAGSIAYEVMV